MKDNEFPTDIICKFIGDIKNSEFRNLYDDNLGIYQVKVRCPKNNHPILPIRVKNTTNSYIELYKNLLYF